MGTRTKGARAAAALAAMLLAGCGNPGPFEYHQRAEYRAETAEVRHDLFFQRGGPRLAGGEAERLQRVLAGLALAPQDDVVVTLPATGAIVLDRQRAATARSAIGRTAARVRLVAPAPGFARLDATPDVARVQVLRYGRIRVQCPTPIDGWERDTTAFYPPPGCSNALNIANMADQPRDLTAPGALSGSDVATSVAAVQRYRAGQVTEPDALASTGGN